MTRRSLSCDPRGGMRVTCCDVMRALFFTAELGTNENNQQTSQFDRGVVGFASGWGL